MKSFAIASPYGGPYCYDFIIYLTLRKKLEEMGLLYDPESLNRIYMLGFPLRAKYNSCGGYRGDAFNIGLVGSYFPQIDKEQLSKFNLIYCSSEFGYDEILKKHGRRPDGLWSIYSPFSEDVPEFELTKNTIELPELDIGFVGNARSRPAIELLLPLLSKNNWRFQWHGYGIKVYHGNKQLIPYWSGGVLPYHQYPEFAKKTKIVLVDMHEEMAAVGCPSFKYIDHLMSGAFVMVHNNKYAEKIGGVSFNSSSDLELKIKKYLADVGAREEIRQRQYELVRKENTVEKTATFLKGVIDGFGK